VSPLHAGINHKDTPLRRSGALGVGWGNAAVVGPACLSFTFAWNVILPACADGILGAGVNCFTWPFVSLASPPIGVAQRDVTLTSCFFRPVGRDVTLAADEFHLVGYVVDD